MDSSLRHFSLFVIMALVIFAPTISTAQDSHFWDSQYGTRSQLLGGLVVGAPSDLSTTFYNPAWLALEQQPGLLLTTKSFEAYNLKVENGFGKGTEPSSTHIVPSPSFFGGKLTTNINGDKVAIAFSYLQRVSFKYDATGIRVDSDPAPPPEGNFWFSGDAYNFTETSEHWAGITFAKRIGKDIYLGITPFGVLRTQNYRNQLSAKGMDSAGNFSHLFTMNQANFWHTRILVKAGLAFNYSPLSFGFTLTTPSLSLLGSGETHTDQSFSGLDAFPPEGTPDTYLGVNYQPDLDPTFKSPLSLAMGASYSLGATSFYFSTEWFNTVGSFDLLSPETFVSQSHPDHSVDYNIRYATRSIINWGVAASHRYSPHFSMYASFWSDKSFLSQEEVPSMMMAFWDLTHLNLGASFEFLDIEFTSGLGYSHGSGVTEHFPSFNFEDNGDIEAGFPETAVTFNRLKFLIGFNLPFSTS